MKVVYASFASAVATSFYTSKDYQDERWNRRVIIKTAHSLSQIILLFRVSQFTLRRTIDHADRLSITGETNKPSR